MTFIRTSSGLQNQALFQNADVIVYIESDPNLDPAKGRDFAYWRIFFDAFYPGLTVQLKPLGGKPHVQNIASRVIRDNLKNVFCAMDRDYDSILHKEIVDDRIFYTFGYGVENEVFSRHQIARIVAGITPGIHPAEDIVSDINMFIDQTIEKDSALLRADQLCRSLYVQGLNREKPASNVEHYNNSLPVRLRRSSIMSSIRQTNSHRVPRAVCRSIKPDRNLVPCHIYFEIVYLTFKRYMRRHSRSSVSKESFLMIGAAVLAHLFAGVTDPSWVAHLQRSGGRDLRRYLD